MRNRGRALPLRGRGYGATRSVVTVTQTAGSGLTVGVGVSWTGRAPRNLRINWGDGGAETVHPAATIGDAATHTYAAGGTDTVTATLDTATGGGGPFGTTGVTVAPTWPPLAGQWTLLYDDRTWGAVDGAALSTITDQSGNGFNGTLVGGDTAAVAKVGVYGTGGKSCLRLAGARYSLAHPAGLVNVLGSASQEPTYVFFAKLTTPNANSSVLLSQGDDVGRVFVGWPFGAPFGTAVADADFAGGPVTFGTVHSPDSPGEPTRRTYRCGAGIKNQNSATPAAPDTTHDVIFGGISNYPSAFKSLGDVLFVGVIPRQLTPAEMLSVSDALYARWGVTNPRAAAAYTVVCEGNSMLGVACGTPCIPERVRVANGLPLGSVFNIGAGSKQTSDITAEAPTLVDPLLPLLSAGGGKVVYYLMEGSNQLSAAAVLAECDARVSAGWTKARIAVASCLPRTSPADYNTNRNTQNTALRAGSSHYGRLADIGADAVMGPDAAAADTNLYGDGVHPTGAGQSGTDGAQYLVADIAAAVALAGA